MNFAAICIEGKWTSWIQGWYWNGQYQHWKSHKISHDLVGNSVWNHLVKWSLHEIINGNTKVEGRLFKSCSALFLLMDKHRQVMVPCIHVYTKPPLERLLFIYAWMLMTSSNGNIFRVAGPLCEEFSDYRWIPLTKASNAELRCFLWSAPEQTVVQTIEPPVIWDTMALIMTSLLCTSNIALIFIWCVCRPHTSVIHAIILLPDDDEVVILIHLCWLWGSFLLCTLFVYLTHWCLTKMVMFWRR